MINFVELLVWPWSGGSDLAPRVSYCSGGIEATATGYHGGLHRIKRRPAGKQRRPSIAQLSLARLDFNDGVLKA